MSLESIEVFDRLAGNALYKYGMEVEYEPVLLQVSENITYLIKNRSSAEKYIMRISRPGYHTIEELYAELEWLSEIKKYTPIIVADPIKGLDGDEVQLISEKEGGKTYISMMFEFLEGSAPDESDENNLVSEFRQLGETTAYLHRQAKMWNGAGKLNRFSWDFDSMIGDGPRWGSWRDAADLTPEYADILEKAVAVIKKRLEKYGRNSETFGLIHADLRLANLLVEDKTIKVIDFDDCGFGWFMHDLASAVSFIEHKPVTESLVKAWLEGYSKVGAITERDMKEIDTFIMQRRLQLLSWIASHYDSDPVKELSIGFTKGTVELAEKYLLKYL